MAEQLLEEQRENWGSRAGFVLAAIGSAVGLGNLWGFPYKLYKYGGGAFLVPYIIAMLIIGIPVLILEFSLGHMTQRAAPNAFRRLGPRKEPAGWWGILLGFVIITYYPVILAWCLSFLYYSIDGILHYGGQLPWAGIGPEGVEKTQNFFLFQYCNMWRPGEADHGWLLGSIDPEIAFCLVAVWLLMFLCIFRGVRTVSKVVLWTVPLPWLMLLILTINGLRLEGATHGLAYYLNPDWTQLLKPTTWRFAFGQVFFSMSLAFGVMITYASFLHRKSDINNNAAIVGLGDLGTSFVAGIAVFSTLGAMSVAASVKVDSVVGEGTVGLAFMAFPYALAQLPFGAYFSTVFFIALITLGIDSAFSITESILASIVDKTGWNRTAVLWGMSFVGLSVGLVYCSRGGLTWLDHIDAFINGPWGIALMGLVECLVLGWMFRISRLREHANERSDWRLGAWWDWNIRLLVPVLLSALFVWSLYDTIAAPDGFLFDTKGRLVVPTLVGLILAGAAPILAVLLSLIRSRVPAEGPRPAGPETSASAPASQGAAGGLLALAGLAGVVAALVVTLRDQFAVRGGMAVEQAVGMLSLVGREVPVAAIVLLGAAGAALAGTVLGALAVVQAERRSLRPAAPAVLAAGGGTVALGGSAGTGLALYVLLSQPEAGAVKHSTEITASAWGVLAVMLALIVMGICWCFYRAIKATAAGGVQRPDAG